MQIFLSLKEENSTLLTLLRFVFWVLFSVEENPPQPIFIEVEKMKVHHYNHDSGGETFLLLNAQCSLKSQSTKR